MPADQLPIEPPDWLSADAQAVWAKTWAELPVGADLQAFAIYCSAIADCNHAQQLLNRSGPVVQDNRGNLVSSPLNRIKTANAGVARSLAKDLGIGVPASVPPVQPDKRQRWRNRRAAERTIEGLRKVGRLEPVDESTIALARTLAEILDTIDADANPAQVASIARVHLSTIRMLRGARDDDDDNGLSDWLEAMSAPMGDASEA